MISEIKINEEQKIRYLEKGYWGEKTLPDYWNDSVRQYGDREYVVDDRGNRYTYREVDELAEKMAVRFRQAGILPQEVISYQIPVWSEFVIVTVACMKVGAVMNPIGLCFAGQELKGLLNLSKTALYLCPARYRNTNYQQNMEMIRESVPTLKAVWILGEESPRADGCMNPAEQSFVSVHSNLVALILCTSGTTRGIKEVMLTHNNILFSELNFNRELGIGKQDVMFMPAPLNHATGFHHGVIGTMLCGAKLVLQQKFDPESAIRLMNQERCTYSMGATPFIYDILKEMEKTGEKATHLKFYLCGGAPVPELMVRKAWSYGIRLCEVYGSTESVPHVFVRPREVLAGAAVSCGRPLEGVEVKVVDDRGNPVGPGIPGEEVSRGPNVFVGYLGDQESTDKALDDDGWFYSGDMAMMDERGNLKIIGRKKDIIIRGGENLSINKIAGYLIDFPAVRDYAILGYPDERMGERICAYVVPKDAQAAVSKDAIIEYLSQKSVPKRFWPERVEMIDAIPRTESGKVKRYLLENDIRRRMELLD